MLSHDFKQTLSTEFCSLQGVCSP